MNVPSVKFNTTDQREFVKTLRKNVNNYFKENNISPRANTPMVIKSVIMFIWYFLPLTLMLTGVVDSSIGVLFMWIIMGFGMTGLSVAVTHDANHGAYSKNQKVNDALSYLMNLMGAYHMNWRIQHNVLHHSYTNISGYDEDIAANVMRFSPHQKKRWIYRFQVIYAPILYSLMTISWMTAKDFTSLYRYHKMNLLNGQGLTYPKALTSLIINKAIYFSLLLVLPLILVDVPWYVTVIGFIGMQLICGGLLAFIFQCAHVQEHAEFELPNEQGAMENNWAIHQLKTTANFAKKSRLFSWFIGGLNFQIEHHLFPNICHIHYRKISEIVKQTAEEYGIPYYEQGSFLSAVKGHLLLLNRLGTI